MKTPPYIEKPGRNDPCPCGSGKKYKKCHGETGVPSRNPGTKTDIASVLDQAFAHEKQREKQQGMGRPIISARVGERRFVAVGSEIFASEKWKTFHDFLISYLQIVFGPEWIK